MKKLFSVLFVCFLTVFALCGCMISSSYPLAGGEIVDVEIDEESGYPKYTVLTSDGKEIGITIDKDTVLSSWMEDVDAEKLRTGDIDGFGGIIISADYNSNKIKPLSKGGEFVVVPSVSINGVMYKNAKTLANGTQVDVWRRYNHMAYQLADGTELLYVDYPSGPENVYVANRESFNDLSETAKIKILEYYNNRGVLYDEDTYLEQAYIDCAKEDFIIDILAQEISPSASNDKIICFMTSVTTPIYDKNESTESRYGEIFDKQTGKYISGYDIFSCDEEQIITTIVQNGWGGFAAEISDTEKAEIRAAFKPEYIILQDDGMEIAFPKGSLPSQEHTYILSIKYTDAIKAIMYDWAIPNQNRG